jgi:hypothetical protein
MPAARLEQKSPDGGDAPARGPGLTSGCTVETTTAQPGKPRHPRVVTALLLAGALLTFVSVFSFWVNRQALNTDNWANTSSKLLENKDIQTQVATFLVNQLYANVDVQAELQQALPPRLQPLAGPAAGGLRDLGQQVAQRALGTPQVQQLWADANRAAHQQLLTILNGGGTAISTGGGTVTLQLGALVNQVAGQLGVGGNAASKLPPGAGNLTVLHSNQLSTAQDVAKLVRHLPIVLTILVLLFFGLALYLGAPRRRETLRSIGIAFVVAGALALIARTLAGNAVVDGLAHTAAVKPAAQATWNIGTSLLVTVASSAIAFGILTIVGAWLAGPTAAAVALRREASPYVCEHRRAAYGIAGIALIALIAWAPIAALRKPFGILLFIVLFAAGTELLRRQILREFPDTQSGGLGERLRARGQALSTAFAGRRVPASAAAGGGATEGAGSPVDDQLTRLERLSALRKDGVLTDAEFETQKRELLSSG